MRSMHANLIMEDKLFYAHVDYCLKSLLSALIYTSEDNKSGLYHALSI